LNKVWLITIVILSFVLISLGGYYYYTDIMMTPKPITANVTATQVLKDDFLFQVSVDKPEYKYGEPVVVYFNLTYLGKTQKLIDLYSESSLFHLLVHNATHNLIVGELALAGSTGVHTLAPGSSFIDRATIHDGYFGYQSKYGGGEIFKFSSNHIYDIQGSVRIITYAALNPVIELISPPIPILINH